MIERTSREHVLEILKQNQNKWNILDIGCNQDAVPYAQTVADSVDFSKFYKNKKFIKVLKRDSLVSTNNVINTNNCYISICKSKYKNKVIILSAIDNLIKGGAGQAVQNFNIKFNFPEKTAL